MKRAVGKSTWLRRAHDGDVYTLVVVGQIKCIAQAVNEKPPNSRPTWLHTSPGGAYISYNGAGVDNLITIILQPV